MQNNLIEVRTVINLCVKMIAKKYRPRVTYHKADSAGAARVNIGGTISVYAIDNFEINTLKGKENVPGFSVVALEYSPGFFDYKAGVGEPPSIDEVELGTTPSAVDAARLALSSYFNITMEKIIEGYYDRKIWEQEEAQEKKWNEENGESI